MEKISRTSIREHGMQARAWAGSVDTSWGCETESISVRCTCTNNNTGLSVEPSSTSSLRPHLTQLHKNHSREPKQPLARSIHHQRTPIPALPKLEPLAPVPSHLRPHYTSRCTLQSRHPAPKTYTHSTNTAFLHGKGHTPRCAAGHGAAACGALVPPLPLPPQAQAQASPRQSRSVASPQPLHPSTAACSP